MSTNTLLKRLILWSIPLVALLGCYGGRVNDGASGSANNQEDLLKGIVTSVPPDTPETLAAKKTKLESNLKDAQEAASKGDLDRSITLLEESMGLEPAHREVLMLLIKTSQLRSRELRAEDPWRCYRLIVQAGGYMRTLRETHKDFSKVEVEMLANVLFDEACAHARSKRQSEFSGSLNAAIDAGFADIERLKSEPDLDLMRKVPEMETLILKATETIANRKNAPSL